MDYKNKPWFLELGLNEGSFSSLPSSTDALTWALKNDVIDSKIYTKWASEFYKTPLIDDSFFNFSMDSSLVEKYKNDFKWSTNCYPIYEWENVLYVACLEPQVISSSQTTCFVIASMNAMETAWNKHQAPQTSVEISNEATAYNDFHSATEIHAVEKSNTVIPMPPPPISDLDFSNLIADNANQTDLTQVPESKNETPSLENLNSNIQSIKNDNSLEDLSFDDLNLGSTNKPQKNFNDDITPPPILDTVTTGSNHDLDHHTQSMGEEVTETDNVVPIYIPKEKRITDQDLTKHTDLNYCQGTKEILSHIFHHLTQDFNQLMWIELSESGQFFPRFAYGPWNLETTAWNHAIDVSKPNIFRVAFKSGFPFHGEVSKNKVNSNYFSLWNSGRTPNHVTVFPLIIDEACFGFITCFDKGSRFNITDSLKKLENLIALSSKAFQKVQQKKAS